MPITPILNSPAQHKKTTNAEIPRQNEANMDFLHRANKEKRRENKKKRRKKKRHERHAGNNICNRKNVFVATKRLCGLKYEKMLH